MVKFYRKNYLIIRNLAAINVHASLLPELRGGAPIHYAILQGKKETGITIMYMVEKLDAGDIISSKKQFRLNIWTMSGHSTIN